MAIIRENLNALKAERAEYHEKADTLTPPQIAEWTAKIKGLNSAVADTITSGAEPCPDCELPPHGMFHEGTPNPFEIGCLNCRDHRVRGVLPEDVVADWNAGKYLPPREPGTAVVTHADATGKILSQKEVKIQTPTPA